jgi:WS/DGAT/MGAT family acyltransferase
MAGSLSRRLTASDAAFLYFERPNAPLHIGSLGIYEGQIPYERFVEHIESRLPNIPRYRQRLAPVPFELAHPTWENDPNFNIKNHIRQIQLPPPGTDEQVAILSAELAAIPLARTRPLWEMFIVNGMDGDRSAIVSKIHHCMVDGVSGIDLLMQVVDLSPKPAPPPPQQHWEPRALPPSGLRLIDAFWDSLEEHRLAAKDLWERAMNPRRQVEESQALLNAMRTAGNWLYQPAPKTPFNIALGNGRRLARSKMSFSELREIRSSLGGTVNDVVLAVLAGALARYLRLHGHATKGLELRVGIPVNVRLEDEQGTLGNRVSAIFIEIPVGELAADERLQTICQRMGEAKEGNQAGAIELLLRTGATTPVPLQALAGLSVSNSTTNLICTNVPGPMIPLYAVGHLLLDHYPLVPLSLGMGLACGVTSYNHNLYFGIMVDPQAVPDHLELGRCIDDSFLDLRDAAGVGPTDLPVFTGQLNNLMPAAVPAGLGR